MKQASDCDMVLVHDTDLVTINGICHGTVSRLLNISYIVLLMSTVTGNFRTSRDGGSPTEV